MPNDDANRNTKDRGNFPTVPFTPGPWRFYDERYPGGRAILPPSGPAVVPDAWEITDADAHLIAAAPDLFAALDGLVAIAETLRAEGDAAEIKAALASARAALAKALPHPSPDRKDQQ